MKRLDIKIGYHCNNHCLFCAQGDKRGHYKQRSSSKIIRDLKNSRKNCDSVVFTGGEPTLHQDFLYFLKSAKDLGFKNIQVQSNGRMFVYEKFCYDSIKAGANQFALALHGHTAIIHDFLTQSPGSFEQTVQGIKNLNTLGQDVVTNTVITSKNYLYLPDIAKLLIKLGMKQIQFAFVHIIGSAWENKNFIVQKKSKLVPYLKKALDIAFTAGKIARTEAIPYCLLQGYEHDTIVPRGIFSVHGNVFLL